MRRYFVAGAFLLVLGMGGYFAIGGGPGSGASTGRILRPPRYGGRGYPTGLSSGYAYSLFTEYNLSQVPVPPWVSDTDGLVGFCRVNAARTSWECLQADGVTPLTGEVEGTSPTYGGSFAQGTGSQIDPTDSSHPTISNASIRSLFGGDYTIAMMGYATTKQASTTIWYEGYDGTRDVYAEVTGGTWHCIDGSGNAATQSGGGIPHNGQSFVACSRNGGVLTAWYNSSTYSGTLTAASGGALTSGAFHMWTGFGAGNATRGQAEGIAFYNKKKTNLQLQTMAWNWWGARTDGLLTNVGSVGALLGKDNSQDSGFVDLFNPAALITDPTFGIHAQQAFTNYWAADALAADTWVAVGSPVVTANASSGPFARWKNAAEGDLITTSNVAALDGVQSLAVVNSTDGGFTASGAGWVNASCFLSQGTAGVTRDKARITFVTDGALDAGVSTCDITGLDGTPRRYPLTTGCAGFFWGAKSVKANLVVGDATPQVGSITVYQCQISQTLELESPMVSNVGVGAGWLELDGGAVPNGSAPGKLEAVFSTVYTSSLMGADKTLAKGAGAYIVDAYSLSASHDALMWTSVTGNPSADGGLGLSSFDSLLYGPSATTENQFSNGGTYPPSQPQEFNAGQFNVASIEWISQTGVLPDGGTGIGCRAKSRLNLCATPATCHATTVVNANTGALGTCPVTTDSMVLGTRGAPAGSSVTSVWDKYVRIYH